MTSGAASSIISLVGEIQKHRARCPIKRQTSCTVSDHPSRGRSALAAPVADLEKAADLFRAMGDPARLRVLELLAGGERCVTEIVTAIKKVVRHLPKLR